LESRILAAENRLDLVENRPEYLYNSYAWTYSNAAPPATGSQVRLNNTDLTVATLINIRKIDGDGADRTPVFLQLTPGDQIRINDWNDATKIHRYRVTGVPTTDATNASIPVAWFSGAGVIPNAKANVAFIVSVII
jgi:hypothetical protein